MYDENENFLTDESPTVAFNSNSIEGMPISEPSYDSLSEKEKRKFLKRNNPEALALKRAANMSGILMLLCIFIPFLFVYLPYLLRNTDFVVIFYPFSRLGSLIDESLGSLVAGEINQILYSCFFFVFLFFAVAKLFKYKISSLCAFSAPKPEGRLPLLFFGMGFCAFSNIASSYVTLFFRSFGFTSSYGSSQALGGFWGFVLALISNAIIPGLVEEFAFRGIIYGALKRFGQPFAIMASSVLFGVLHGNLTQIPFAFLVGIVLGFIRAKSGSIWICVAVHIINNSISVLFDYPLAAIPAEYQNIIYALYLSFAMLLAVIGVAMLSKKQGAAAYELKPGDGCPQRVLYSVFYGNIFVILTFLVVGIDILLSWRPL